MPKLKNSTNKLFIYLGIVIICIGVGLVIIGNVVKYKEKSIGYNAKELPSVVNIGEKIYDKKAFAEKKSEYAQKLKDKKLKHSELKEAIGMIEYEWERCASGQKETRDGVVYQHNLRGLNINDYLIKLLEEC